MAGPERLEEDQLSALCHVNDDCSRYTLCLRANSCRCLAWGKCELLRIAGQTCLSNPQCGPGLLCRETVPNRSYRCMPITHLVDLPMFPDQPENNTNTIPDIAPSYIGSYLIAGITASLVIACVILAIWYRCSSPNTDPCKDIEMTSHSSGLVGINTTPQLPNYASTSTRELKAPHHPPFVLPK